MGERLVKKATSKKARIELSKGACSSFRKSSKLVRKRAFKLAMMADTTEAIESPSLQELIDLRDFWCAEKIAAGEECDRLTASINAISL